MIEIKHRDTGAVLFSSDVETLREALEKAVAASANLDGANLARANLASANLDGANLVGANLARARGLDLDWMAPIREDLRKVLDAAPHEVPGLLAKLWAGEVDGTAYQGACACLVGTIANIKGVSYTAIPGLKPDSERPTERWFYGILKGHTPVNNATAAYAAAVITQWQHERASK